MINPETAQIIQDISPLLILAPTLLAFGRKTRQEIGQRDNWTCTFPGCRRSFKDGWIIHAAHFQHDRNNPGYDDPNMGRMLCVEHHAIEELSRGNEPGAILLLSGGLYTDAYKSKYGQKYLSINDIRGKKRPWNPLDYDY
jgi:hypothetical protein